MKSLTKTEIIELAERHSLPEKTVRLTYEFTEYALFQFVDDLLNAASIGKSSAPSIGTIDALIGQFTAVPVITLELQCNRLFMVGEALSFLEANIYRKKQSNDFAPMSESDEAAYLHAASVVIREASRVMASLARNDAGSVQ